MMELCIGLRYEKEEEFIQLPDVVQCLSTLQLRGHNWHIAAHSSDGDILFPDYNDRVQPDGSEHLRVFLTDDDQISNLAHQFGFIVIGYGDKGRFSDASVIFESAEALSAGYLEMQAYHAAGIPFTIGSLDGVTLRESIDTDFDEIYHIFQNERMPMFALESDGGKDIKQHMRESFEHYVRCQYRYYGFGIWTVLNHRSQIVGWVGFSIQEEQRKMQKKHQDQSTYLVPDLGYIIHADHRREGLAYRAGKIALQFARNELQLPEAALFTDIGNAASIHLAEKLGFKLWAKNGEGGLTYVKPLWGSV